MEKNPHDPKGLIREAYRIDGIGPAECRTIFLDWALSLPDGHDQHGALENLYQTYAKAEPDHPMSEVLQMGLKQITAPRRRGGWRGRSRN